MPKGAAIQSLRLDFSITWIRHWTIARNNRQIIIQADIMRTLGKRYASQADSSTSLTSGPWGL